MSSSHVYFFSAIKVALNTQTPAIDNEPTYPTFTPNVMYVWAFIVVAGAELSFGILYGALFYKQWRKTNTITLLGANLYKMLLDSKPVSVMLMHQYQKKKILPVRPDGIDDRIGILAEAENRRRLKRMIILQVLDGASKDSVFEEEQPVPEPPAQPLSQEAEEETAPVEESLPSIPSSQQTLQTEGIKKMEERLKKEREMERQKKRLKELEKQQKLEKQKSLDEEEKRKKEEQAKLAQKKQVKKGANVLLADVLEDNFATTVKSSAAIPRGKLRPFVPFKKSKRKKIKERTPLKKLMEEHQKELEEETSRKQIKEMFDKKKHRRSWVDEPEPYPDPESMKKQLVIGILEEGDHLDKKSFKVIQKDKVPPAHQKLMDIDQARVNKILLSPDHKNAQNLTAEEITPMIHPMPHVPGEPIQLKGPIEVTPVKGLPPEQQKEQQLIHQQLIEHKRQQTPHEPTSKQPPTTPKSVPVLQPDRPLIIPTKTGSIVATPLEPTIMGTVPFQRKKSSARKSLQKQFEQQQPQKPLQPSQSIMSKSEGSTTRTTPYTTTTADAKTASQTATQTGGSTATPTRSTLTSTPLSTPLATSTPVSTPLATSSATTSAVVNQQQPASAATPVATNARSSRPQSLKRGSKTASGKKLIITGRKKPFKKDQKEGESMQLNLRSYITENEVDVSANKLTSGSVLPSYMD
ncbi:hypothetical protein HELRODRAFT_178581 [Helobdella robusta]|uniref:Uncharacterized protein n=1 Tax=Helobdella robusta TaxID=6412 RepID=T1FDE9_HELRO|nr:hypothetical protein HELRODRAFT_178581 [Helobdella robusta]ESN97128.1 hypothetical protein HELRODRAFT_178581 [Helobdella robusta]